MRITLKTTWPSWPVNTTAAIDLLQNLPDSPARTQRELLLQLAVGPALNAVKALLHRSVASLHTRARP
jgi:hypothetical protein